MDANETFTLITHTATWREATQHPQKDEPPPPLYNVLFQAVEWG